MDNSVKVTTRVRKISFGKIIFYYNATVWPKQANDVLIRYLLYLQQHIKS